MIQNTNRRPRGKKIRIFGFLIILLLYLAFYGFIIDKESVYIPAWTVDRDSIATGVPDGVRVIPFQNNGIFGYLSPRGELLYRGRTLYGTTLSTLGFINYSRLSETLVIRNPAGDITESLDILGYPVFLSDRLLVFSPDRTRMSEFDIQGNHIWSRSFSAPVTALDVSDEYLLAGLLNGSLSLLSKKGEPLYSVVPGGSRIEVIYGCAVTEDAGSLAVLSGLDPQKLLLIENKNDSYRIEEIADFDTPIRRPVFMEFSPSGDFLVMALEERTLVYSAEDALLRDISTDAALEGLRLGAPGEVSAFFFRSAEGSSLLRLIDLETSFEDTLLLPKESSFLYGTGESLYLGIDHFFLRIDREEL